MFSKLPESSQLAAAAKLCQSCPTLCDPIDGSPPGSPAPGILQARTLEWVAISFSNAWKWSHSVVSDSSQPHGLQPTRLLHPWDSPGKSTGVGRQCIYTYIYIYIYVCVCVCVYGFLSFHLFFTLFSYFWSSHLCKEFEKIYFSFGNYLPHSLNNAIFKICVF